MRDSIERLKGLGKIMENCWKRLPLKHAYNIRDLGGYAAKNGMMTKYHVFYRGDGLSQLKEDEWNLLKENGINTIFDLRSPSEANLMDYHSEKYGIRTYRIPLQKENLDLKNLELLSQSSMRKSMEDGYVTMIEENLETIAKLLNQICHKIQEGAVLIHCTAGKDRTGIIAALLLWLCQVPDADIIADYMVSEIYNRENPMMKDLVKTIDPVLLESPAIRMRMLLDYFRENHMYQKLMESGFTIESLELLQKNFLK